MGSFLFWLEGAALFENKGSNSFGLQGQSELDFPGYKKHVIDGREMIDNADLCKILKIGKRSIYRYRKNGELKPRKLRGKLYYDIEDVKKLIKKIMD